MRVVLPMSLAMGQCGCVCSERAPGGTWTCGGCEARSRTCCTVWRKHVAHPRSSIDDPGCRGRGHAVRCGCASIPRRAGGGCRSPMPSVSRTCDPLVVFVSFFLCDIAGPDCALNLMNVARDHSVRRRRPRGRTCRFDRTRPRRRRWPPARGDSSANGGAPAAAGGMPSAPRRPSPSLLGNCSSATVASLLGLSGVPPSLLIHVLWHASCY